ncbi:MAG: hypothetical protein K2G94_05300 [Muribaculaceae bacterium]|nr:hypothetical protein [Muribaculaceae bacterium]MDE5972144.1 hypothetical protein [Muribaculaceae bacterium]MDE7143772.1 hypothetical protein [Muribaculaceae bacterium]
MKKICTLLCTAITALGGTVDASADDGVEVTRLTVTLTSGTQEHFDFPDNPEVTFPGTQMAVRTDVAETVYERADVAGYSFTKGLRNVSVETVGTTAEYTFSYSGTTVTITGQDITSADVYTTSGTRALTATTATHGTIIIELGNLPSGTYIVSPAGHTAVKIKK